MAKILIQHPKQESIVQFNCPDMLACTAYDGLTLVAEHEYTTIRITLNWDEVGTVLIKAMKELEHIYKTMVP